MEAGGIALAIPGDRNDPLCDDLTHCTHSPETSQRFAGLVESFAHSRGRGVVERHVLDRNDIHRDLPKRYERERYTVTVSQSPRLEAVSMILQAVPFNGAPSVQNRPLSQLHLTCPPKRLDDYSN